MAQWILKNRSARLVRHAVVAVECGTWIFLVGVVSGEKQSQQWSEVVSFFIFRECNRTGNGPLNYIVTEIVKTDGAFFRWQTTCDDFTATKPFRRGVSQGDVDDTTRRITNVGRDTTRHNLYLFNG